MAKEKADAAATNFKGGPPFKKTAFKAELNFKTTLF